MRSKDGSEGFDYCGKYDKVKTCELIELTTSGRRKTINRFIANGSERMITQTFEVESKTPVHMQRDFCQNVLNNFKKYAENKLRNAMQMKRFRPFDKARGKNCLDAMKNCL